MRSVNHARSRSRAAGLIAISSARSAVRYAAPSATRSAAGGFYDEFDVDSHTFGLIATVEMYDAVTHSTAFRGFATAQRDWLFGANAWGASFMVGEGANFPALHAASGRQPLRQPRRPPADGAARSSTGRTTAAFRGGLGSLQDGVRRCPADGRDRYRPFNGRGSRYLDDVRSWQTSEPAIDYDRDGDPRRPRCKSGRGRMDDVEIAPASTTSPATALVDMRPQPLS